MFLRRIICVDESTYVLGGGVEVTDINPLENNRSYDMVHRVQLLIYKL